MNKQSGTKVKPTSPHNYKLPRAITNMSSRFNMTRSPYSPNVWVQTYSKYEKPFYRKEPMVAMKPITAVVNAELAKKEVVQKMRQQARIIMFRTQQVRCYKRSIGVLVNSTGASTSIFKAPGGDSLNIGAAVNNTCGMCVYIIEMLVRWSWTLQPSTSAQDNSCKTVIAILQADGFVADSIPSTLWSDTGGSIVALSGNNPQNSSQFTEIAKARDNVQDNSITITTGNFVIKGKRMKDVTMEALLTGVPVIYGGEPFLFAACGGLTNNTAVCLLNCYIEVKFYCA